MKKSVVFLIIAMSILLISINFVSANLFDEIWGKITGSVTENETGEEVDVDEKIELETAPEKQCEEGEMKYYGCPDGTKVPNCECESNMWVCKIFKDENCPDSPEPETCAGKIKVTFNKGSYKLGDPVKIIIETFDSQGNHIPNYAFYAQMYDNMWHSPGLEKTDNKGYFIVTTTAEKPAGGVTEVKFKVYTKEIGSCGSIEDTAEVKFELGECGIGGCIPEPECKDKIRMCGGACTPCPEDDREGEIFYPCSGCELEDKCYPYGYRKAGNYCSDENNVFINQLGDDEKCENNFECKTNFCINGNCVSSNIWNKFLGWFKKLFGGGEDEQGPEICSKLLIEKDIEDYEYVESAYGHKDHQVALYSEDGEQIDIVKCCLAVYESPDGTGGAGVVCPFDNRKDVENTFYWLANKGEIILGENYNGQKVYRGSEPEPEVIIWTSNVYIIATGGGPKERQLAEEVADAYFKKYKNDLEEIDIGDVPPPRPPNSIELCGEITDSEEQAGCYIDVAISKSDAEICENIDINDRKDKCYINVAEHTGDVSICENVDDNSLREKCYFWVAGQTGESNTCVGIVDADLQAMCYVDVAIKTSDSSFCEKITNIPIADKCYRNVGIQTNNKVLCEKIIEDQAKQKCLDNTS